MMELDVPIRRVETYRADDGRIVEHHLFYKKIKTNINTEEEIEFSEKQESFIGVSPIPNLPLRFEIEANSIEEAFDNYLAIWNVIVAELENKIDPSIIDTINDGIIVPGDIDFSDFTDEQGGGGLII